MEEPMETLDVSPATLAEETPPVDNVVKRVMKGAQTFMHDLFKLEISKMKKNVSYRKYQPIIEEIEHTHMFHTVSSRGKPQKYSVAVGGHFHEITVVQEGDTFTAKCGPALHKVWVKTRGGKYKQVVEQISFYDENRDVEVPDDHTHEVTYKWSEELSPLKIKDSQRKQAASLAGMLGKKQ